MYCKKVIFLKEIIVQTIGKAEWQQFHIEGELMVYLQAKNVWMYIHILKLNREKQALKD